MPLLTNSLAPEQLRATQFVKQMGSGRTQPWLMVAQTDAQTDLDVVVKLRGSPQLAPCGLAAELVAALLARDLGLPVQPPLVVSFDTAFVNALPDSALQRIGRRSIGMNFGTRKWDAGFTMWTQGLPVSKDLRRTLAEILAFDCIIQNPDRTRRNPNCVFRRDEVIAFDHDLAFSHLLSVAPTVPWEPDSVGFVGEHVFRSAVAGHSFDPDRLRGALAELDTDRIEDYVRCTPDSWTPTPGIRPRITQYLLECIEKFDLISQNLEALL